ncbi:bifunctional [glutamate--ammonia ligase]-adenylyl-L-tyrosine phosphorylase/[glutamate--ammonia-ligase] adenylyltransferase [Pseudomonas sp. HK3]
MWSQVPACLTEFSAKRRDLLTALINSHSELANINKSEALLKTLTLSDYVFNSIQSCPTIAQKMLADDFLGQPLNQTAIENELSQKLEQCTDDTELYQQLREFRRLHQMRMIHRDLNRASSLQDTLTELSFLADTNIRCTLAWLDKKLQLRYGQPMAKKSGEPQSLIVIAMGKQGAGELNLSSDIDLIFAFSENGDTHASDGQKSISNQEYFTKLGQALIQSLDKVTQDGFVYRVDMRLRPYGQSGPLAMNFAALENYYHDQGRDWERYAMIKARAVTGNAQHIQELMKILRPFSYRKYVDFSAFESLREMKARIRQETIRRNLGNNVKLGSGGIREIEFIAQAFQLIRGGKEIELQQPNIFKVFNYLKEHEYLPFNAVKELLAAYHFLRDAEHAIQGINDEQSQTLPTDGFNQARIACYMGFEDWATFATHLDEHRDNVILHFKNIVADDSEQEKQEDLEPWQIIWFHQQDDEHPGDQSSDPINTIELQQTLQKLRDLADHKMQAIGKQRLDKVMPLLLKALWQCDKPQQTLERLVPLLEAILRRTAYLVLLSENPSALQQLVRLCGASPWIAKSIAETPLLLDELLHPAHLYNPNDKAGMIADLDQRLLRIEPLDLEEQMDALRHYASANKLQIAASDITGALPLMKVSDHLTWLAETVLERALWMSWEQMVDKYGHPSNAQGDAVTEPEFLILGYGKLGGIELSYGSDLDMVFLHSGTVNKYTKGERELENGVFYTRMGQRLIHILNTTTRAGQLYEADMRLRPSGSSGMIVASLNAFEKYQQQEAWTWEHQALIRARVITGDDAVAQKYTQIRTEILTKDRDPKQLQQEVREMREKMRDNLGSQSVGKTEFQLKQDAGGIVDIEFMVQYLVLAQCKQHPQLLSWTDNIRLLETLASHNIIDTEQSDALKQAYIAYRSLAHRRALQNQKLLSDPNELDQAGLTPHIDTVKALWQQIMNSAQ